MFSKIYNYFFTNKSDEEEIWVNKKLNDWKNEKFANNRYLNYIPTELIIKKKNELKREYRNIKR